MRGAPDALIRQPLRDVVTLVQMRPVWPDRARVPAFSLSPCHVAPSRVRPCDSFASIELPGVRTAHRQAASGVAQGLEEL